LPATLYLVTRRCSERRLLLRPSAVTNAIFLYVLALAVRRFGVELHAVCILSNHYHLLLTDRAARLPAFMQYLDSLVARAINASLGRWEGFFASAASYSAVAHESPEDVISKAAYVLANPVAAGLVRSGREWPGVWLAPGAPKLTASRPKVFFNAAGYLPESVDLELTTPACFASDREFQDRLWPVVSELEEQSRRRLESEGRGFLGVARVLAQKPTARPAPGEPRRNLNPRVAARDKWKRMEALSRLVGFLRAYRKAWSARRAGVDGVLFPAGTYLLRVLHGVECAAPA
jgi:putative transposase